MTISTLMTSELCSCRRDATKNNQEPRTKNKKNHKHLNPVKLKNKKTYKTHKTKTNIFESKPARPKATVE
jgi:hypothetical protein